MVSVVGTGDLHYFKDDRWVSVGTQFVAATGGTETTATIDGVSYKIHRFTSSGDFVVTSPGEVEVLLVAGGGGGASGGGGGGGVVQQTLPVAVGTAVVTVGAGGVGWVGNNSSDIRTAPYGGSDSSFQNVTAVGGGLGGRAEVPGYRGGSGGGGGASSGAVTWTAGDNVDKQGNVGGRHLSSFTASPFSAAGGGGAGQAGGDQVSSSIAGDGGDGITINFAGTSVTYAGGGGGGVFLSGGTAGSGGTGGGGDGRAGNVAGVAGTDELGGGGGGTGNGATAGAGGDGVVVIRYRL